MPSGFELAPEALTAAQADVGRAHAALTAALGDVRAEVTSVVGSSWRGAAATAFGDGFEEWCRGAEQVLDALQRTGVTLGVSRRAYDGSDDATSDGFARLAARLGGAA